MIDVKRDGCHRWIGNDEHNAVVDVMGNVFIACIAISSHFTIELMISILSKLEN